VVSIWYFLRGILFGYAGAIIAMGLPNVLSYLFIGIIAFMQIGSIVYVFAWFVSAIRGGGV
jgi:hypothetical protein